MSEIKPVLAIETSDKNCGVCLYFDNEKYYEFSFRLKNAHSEKIFELLDKIFQTAGSAIENSKYIAVSAGPGSFTGLRIGMSVAKGLAFGASLPVVPVPTFEAMALQLSDFYNEETEFSIANKLNSEEIYFAGFKVKSNNYIFEKNLSVIKYSELNKNERIIFGSAVNRDNAKFVFSAPSAKYIAAWAEKFGGSLLTYNYDLLEPDYLKNFIIKDKKND